MGGMSDVAQLRESVQIAKGLMDGQGKREAALRPFQERCAYIERELQRQYQFVNALLEKSHPHTEGHLEHLTDTQDQFSLALDAYRDAAKALDAKATG